jgi:predicted flap endonuclease-1-like 5' DNA nuclease
MSKLLSPKVWYLVGIGAAALAVDGARRLVKRRRHQGEGDGSANGHDLPEAVVTETPLPTETKPKRTRTKTASKKVEKIAVDHEPAASNLPTAVMTPVAIEDESPPEPLAPTTYTTDETPKADDLTQVKGIGPTYARRLVAAGYDSYASIAAAPAETLREIAKAPAMTDIEAWIDGARALAL